MRGFIGRRRELGLLWRMLRRTPAGAQTGALQTPPGRLVLMRGRRRVGKSRLVEEFIDRTSAPHLFFTASAMPTARADLAQFSKAGAGSTLPGALIFDQHTIQNWRTAFQLLARALPTASPSIVVFDEMPYLMANDPDFGYALRDIFDRELARLPVLLVCIGSDLTAMQELAEPGHPFHQRATELVVPALDPAQIASTLTVSAAEAFDAYLVTGGLPLNLNDWPERACVFDFLEKQVVDPTSALLVNGERALAAEFPAESLARQVLTAVGSGERTFSLIGRAAGGLQHTSLSRALQQLVARRLVDAVIPLSAKSSRETRYLVAEPYLGFWLRFLGPHRAEIERGRGDLVIKRIRQSWTAWRARAIEPVIRESLLHLRGGELPCGTGAIGGYWTRSNDPEIDIVTADHAPLAQRITAVGSIKWLENRPFNARDLARLIVERSQLPGADDTTALLAVTRAGTTVTADGLRAIGPEELLAAWR